MVRFPEPTRTGSARKEIKKLPIRRGVRYRPAIIILSGRKGSPDLAHFVPSKQIEKGGGAAPPRSQAFPAQGRCNGVRHNLCTRSHQNDNPVLAGLPDRLCHHVLSDLPQNLTFQFIHPNRAIGQKPLKKARKFLLRGNLQDSQQSPQENPGKQGRGAQSLSPQPASGIFPDQRPVQIDSNQGNARHGNSIRRKAIGSSFQETSGQEETVRDRHVLAGPRIPRTHPCRKDRK